MPDQLVRVPPLCPFCNRTPHDCCFDRVILATLADPAMAALIEDGRRWRNLRDKYTHEEARAMFTRRDHPTAEPEDDGA